MYSNRIQGNSSFWRRDGSSEDQQSAPSGNSQPKRSSAFSGGWGRQGSSSSSAAGSGGLGRPSSSNPQASGGSGWGRQGSFNRPAAGGGAARPSSPLNFTVVLIAALLLLPGVTQPIADEFTKAYIQTNRIIDPHTQDDIDRAIAAFHRKHPQKAPAPPEGYTPEHVIHCFHQKYELPENLRETFEGFVQSYITKNQKPFTMQLQIAVERALLKIYELISKENGGRPIPEKDNRPPAPAPAPAPSPSLQPPPPHFHNHGARIFEEVIAHGLSPKTIGHEMFHKLMKMKNGPQSDHIWAFESCPHLRTLIRTLSIKGRVAGISYISCFISGFIIEPKGTLVQFYYPNFDNPMIGWKRDDMVGKRVIFWTSEVGQVIYTKKVKHFDLGQHDYTLGVGRRGADYAGGGIAYNHDGEVCTWGTLKLEALNEEMKADRDAFFEREHVTAPERENLDVGKNHEIERKIRRDPGYKAACKEAIAQIGGIPVSLCRSHQEATAAEGSDHCGAAAPDDAVMIFCYHRNCVMSHGNYTPCLDCKRHPGKQPIMDGWCTEVVGYRQKP